MQPLPLASSKTLSSLRRKPHTQKLSITPLPRHRPHSRRPHSLASTALFSVSTELPFLGISKKYLIELKNIPKEATKNVLSNDSQIGMNIEILRGLFLADEKEFLPPY